MPKTTTIKRGRDAESGQFVPIEYVADSVTELLSRHLSISLPDGEYIISTPSMILIAFILVF